MIYFIYGSNSFLCLEKKNHLINEHITKYDQFSVSQFDGTTDSADSVVQSLLAIPFLSEKQLVVVRDVFANKNLLQKLEEHIKHIPDSTDIIFYETKPDKRLTFYKVLKKDAIIFEYETLGIDELVKWVVNYAKELQGEITPQTAKYLIERSTQDQLSLSNEIKKLISYDGNISKDSVDLLTEQSYNNTVFDLLSAIFSQKKEQSLLLFHQLKDKNVESFEILSMIIWQVHIYLIVVANRDLTHKEIVLATKINPFVLQKSADAVRRVNIETIKKWIIILRDIDMASKTKAYNLDAAIEYFILSA